MFTTRWRWNASRSLALLQIFQRQKGASADSADEVGRFARQRSFPDAIACQENLTGERAASQIPDHPLVNETIRDCLTEAMDLEGLTAVLKADRSRDDSLCRGRYAGALVRSPTKF